jgi:chemotaxis protein methyltransferase CheR
MKTISRTTSDQQMSRLSKFVAGWLGLHFPKKRWIDLDRNISHAARELGLPDVDECIELLLSGQLGKDQEQIITSHLTIGETYFFREQKSFDILQSSILPDLIASRRGKDQRLRFWSAGCSTGEEPYSIAMLLARILPDLPEWQITILGSDVNSQALGKALKGVYSDWSFRGVQPWIRDRYFTKTADGLFELHYSIRKMVTFAVLNLAEDAFPSLATNTNAMDIIFCRNVLMYFEQQCQQRVLGGFQRALLEGGWLSVSPCETSSSFSDCFDMVMFEGTALYRKNLTRRTAPSKPLPSVYGPQSLHVPLPYEAPCQPASPLPAPQTPARQATPTKVEEPTRTKEESTYEEALALYRQGGYGAAADMLSALLAKSGNAGVLPPLFGRSAALLAHVLANQGQIVRALEWTERAIAVDKLNAELYYLRATIYQEQGTPAAAIASLKQALYLDQGFVPAHFTLGTLTLHEGKLKEADKHFANALSLLEAYPADEAVPGLEGMTAGRLSEIIAATRAGIATR